MRRRPFRTLPTFLASRVDRVSDVSTQVASVPFWWHSIDLGSGIVTPGDKSAEFLREELADLRLPDLTGRTVLDVGAWDGYFSFAAERLGASRVVALDHYVWSLNLAEQRRYYEDCLAKGIPAEPFEDVPGLWDAQGLPGKRGFDCAHEVLRSIVEPVVADFMEMDLYTLGRFDVVFYLGVLYHMRHPLLALERLARVTAGSAFIETQAVEFEGISRVAACEFFPSSELRGDPSNWWCPTVPALISMCREAGFARVELIAGSPGSLGFVDGVARFVAIVRADI